MGSVGFCVYTGTIAVGESHIASAAAGSHVADFAIAAGGTAAAAVGGIGKRVHAGVAANGLGVFAHELAAGVHWRPGVVAGRSSSVVIAAGIFVRWCAGVVIRRGSGVDANRSGIRVSGAPVV